MALALRDSSDLPCLILPLRPAEDVWTGAPSRIIVAMKKRTREKVALLLFALLVVLGGSVLLRYFETGRSLNVVATVADDAFGQMSGYTAIVFDGTFDPLDALRPTQVTHGDEATPEPDSLGAMVISKLSQLPLSLRERPVYSSDVRALYEEKGAGVITLDLHDLSRYRTPRILMAGDRKVGVVAVDYYASARQLALLKEQMEALGAESFVCLAPRLSCLATIEDFNVVVVTDDDSVEPGTGMGEGAAHVVYAPERAQVGVVLLTNLNVPSSKVYADL